MRVVLSLLFIVLSSAVTGFSQAAPAEPAEARLFEQVYLARDNGFGKPGEAATEFVPTDIPIHCVVVLSNASQATVKMDLVAVSVAGVRAESKVISSSYTTRDMQDRVFFKGRPQGLWVQGAYRADIYIDGNLVGKLPFTIRSAAGAGKPATHFQPRQPVKPRNVTAKKT